jgi:hypothetical protein
MHIGDKELDYKIHNSNCYEYQGLNKSFGMET